MDIDNIKREDILKKIDSLRDGNKRVYESAKEHVDRVLNTFIVNHDLENICSFRKDHDNEYIEIKVDDKHDIDLYIRKDWETKKRKLSINFCSFGSFYSNDMEKRDYLIVLGLLTKEMENLEKDLVSYDWWTYDEIREEFYYANHELQAYDQEVKNREFRKKKEDALGLLVEGARIFIGKKREWKDGSGFTEVDDIREIEKVCNKTVNIHGMWRRLKKCDVTSHIANGTWKIV